jgi:hypothetical protein
MGRSFDYELAVQAFADWAEGLAATEEALMSTQHFALVQRLS